MGLVIIGCGSFAPGCNDRNAECGSLVVIRFVLLFLYLLLLQETGVVEWTGRDEINDVKVGSQCRVDPTASVVSQTAGECFLHPPTHFTVFVYNI